MRRQVPEKDVYRKLQEIVGPEYASNNDAVLEEYSIEQPGGQSIGLMQIDKDIKYPLCPSGVT